MPSNDAYFDTNQIALARRCAFGAAVIAAAGGALVLAGWALNLNFLTTVVPGQAPMKPFTALALLLLGAALWLVRAPAAAGQARSPWPRRLALLGAGLAGLLGGLFLLEYVLGVDFGFDQALFGQALAAGQALPLGRPAAVTAMCLLLLGLALLALDRRPGWLAPSAALLAMLLAGLALLGYAYAVTSPQEIWPYGSVAPQTGLLIVVLGLGILAARPEGAITRIVTTQLAGSVVARRLLPAAVLVPFVLGLARLYGQRLGLYDTAFGVALLVTSNVVVFTALILVIGRLLNHSDARRVAAHAALRESEENLHLLLDGVQDHAIYMLDAQGRVITWNKAAERVDGYTEAEIIGQPVSIFYPPEEAAAGKPARALATAAEQGSTEEVGLRVRKDGSQFWAIVDTAVLRDRSGALRGYAKVTRDITERKQGEDALRESQQRLLWTLEASRAGAWDWDLTTGAARWSPEMYDLWGVAPGTVMATENSVALVDERDRERVNAGTATSIANHSDAHYEFRIQHATRGERWMETHSRAVYDGRGQAIAMLGMTFDISERKQAEAALRTSEERFAKAFRASPAAMTMTTVADGRFVDANDRFLELLGYARDEVIGQTSTALGMFPDPAERAELVRRLQSDGKVRNLDLTLLTKSGQRRNVLFATDSIELEGQATILATMIDDTERQQAQGALRISEERFAKAFRASPAAMTVTRLADGRFVDVNQRFLEVLGYARDEVIGHTSAEIGLSANSSGQSQPVVARWREYGTVRNVEVTLISKARQPCSFLLSLEDIDLEGEPHALAILVDNTERKQAVEALHQLNAELEARVAARTAELAANEAKLRTLFEVLPVGVSILDRDRHIVESNPALGRILHMPQPGLTAGDYYAGRSFIYPDGSPMPPQAYASMRAFVEQRPVLNVETGMVLETGETIWLDLSAAPLPGPGLGVVTATVDITERRQVEAELRQSNERFAKAFNSNPTAITITRVADNVFVDVNAGFLGLFGYTRAELVNQPAPDLNINTNAADRAEIMRQFHEHGSVLNHEIVLRTKAGELRHVLLSADRLDLAGQPHILTTILDITARKQAEAALLESETKFRVLFDVLPVGVSIVDPARRVLQSNPALSRIIKLSAASVSAAAYMRRKTIRPDGSDMPEAEWASTRALAEQRPIWNIETGSVLESGETIWFDSSAVPLPVAGLGAVVVTVDITERKAAALVLAHERDLMQALMDNIPDTIYFKDTASRFTRVNRAQAEYLHLPSPEAAIGLTDVDLQEPVWARAVFDEEQQSVMRGQPLVNRVDDYVAADGQRHWLSSTKMPLKDAGGRVTGLVGISRDITALKQAEARLQASLTEKEVLLKEIHHRVKNNLQIISSLLRMQADSLEDPKLRSAFDDSQRRVRSMALIHEQLYRSADLTHIDFGEYVNGLIRQLRHSQMQWGSSLRMRVEIEDVTLEIDRAIPLGLLVNELVTNSLKYAFPVGRVPAEVWVTAARDAAGTLTLVVGDSGVGMPETVDIEQSSSMGWQLVQSFVSQLHAHYTLQRQPGTVFTLTVPNGKAAHG